MILEPNSNIKNIRNKTRLNSREFQKYNLLKYRVICAIMDYMAFLNGVRLPNQEYIREVFEEDKIVEMLCKNKIINLYSKDARADYNSIIAEMKIMGLVAGDNGVFAITPYMIEAYQKQTFHQILASLLVAESSRKLGLRTLWVSIIAVLISAVALCLNSSVQNFIKNIINY